MGTLLNALRRMQNEQGNKLAGPHQPSSTTLQNESGKLITNSRASPQEMNPSIQPPVTVPGRLHGSRKPEERPPKTPGYAGLSHGAMDERVEETLAHVNALLASALVTRDELHEYIPAPETPSPTQRFSSYSQRILEIAKDGTVESPTEIASNWQSTLEMIDRELQQCDCPDTLSLVGDYDDDQSNPCDLLDGDCDSHDTSILRTQRDDSELTHPTPFKSRTHRLVADNGAKPHSTLTTLATEGRDQQFCQALDYAAHVVSETKHLTMDLLDSVPASPQESHTPPHVADEAEFTVDENQNVSEAWEPIPTGVEIQPECPLPDRYSQYQQHEPDASADPVDVEGEIDWEDEEPDGSGVGLSTEEPDPIALTPFQPPITVLPQQEFASTQVEPQHPDPFEERLAPRMHTCTAFEQELAIRMANVRYQEQCRKLADRMRQDLDDGPDGGRAVVLVGCEVACDLSDVTAALGFIFSQSYSAQVLLVDGQFSRQILSRHYHLSGSPGLTDACKSMDRWNQLVQPTHHENLFVMPAGSRVDRCHPTEDILQELVQRMRDRFDLVIVDIGEPSSPLSSPCLQAADAAYLVVQLGRTNRSLAMGTIAHLKKNSRTLKGCIVINSPC